ETAAPAPPTTRATPPQARQAAAGIVPVLFGTTRRRSGNNDPNLYFTDQEAEKNSELTLGRVQISVPLARMRGTISEPNLLHVIIEKATSSTPAIFAGIQRIPAADPARHFAIAYPIEEYTEQTFQQTLAGAVAHSQRKEALVYVHGFANSFRDAAFRTAQLSRDLSDTSYDLVPVMFSWPSDPGLLDYRAASGRVWAASQALAAFLDQLASTVGYRRVHIVAHSKGAEVLGLALHEMKSDLLVRVGTAAPVSKFNQIILAAPDIRAEDFDALVLPAVRSHHQVTTYVASNDGALRLSDAINTKARAGDIGRGLSLGGGAEVIDVSKVNSRRGGHSSFAESERVLDDIRYQLQGKAISQRGLQQVKRKTRGYWILEGGATP
ncbi:MAG TPA: alpha/beta hydrolase, partial [Burkholderiaceae bacterium]